MYKRKRKNSINVRREVELFEDTEEKNIETAERAAI